MNARFLRAAQKELEDVIDYYNEQKEGLGNDLAWEAESALKRILLFPRAWSILSADVRRCRLNRFPYGLVYTVRENEILVVAVMHLRRKPGYWKDRL
jgi:plasmid stabilization system protein ParE